MKSKMKFLSWMFIASLFVVFNTSCSDDDDDKKDNTDYAKVMAGDYTGTVSVPAITAMGIPAQTIEEVDLAVDYVEFNNVKLSLDPLIISEMMSIPAVNCACTVSKNGVSGSTEVSIPVLGDTPVEVSGSMENLKITIKVTPPGSPIQVPLTVTYSGEKLTE